MKNYSIIAILSMGIAMASAQLQTGNVGTVVHVDPALDEIIPANPEIQKVAGGFKFVEGPIWTHEGFLLFSDIPNNAVMKWTPDGQVSVFLKPSGYSGAAASPDEQPGSNGLTIDREGRLILCEHGNRRVARLEKDGRTTVLADRYDGKRFNSPNDVVYKSDGSLYFTDPPYGLAKQDEDPRKELPFNGIFRAAAGKVTLLYQDLKRPNGIAFSPDEKFLYIANSDEARKIWMRFEVTPDGTLRNPGVFYDATSSKEDGLPDGMKVDQKGNVYATGPGGVWIFSPSGKHLGTIKPPEVPANCNWGDADGKTLYMTARTGVYRVRLKIPGVRP